MKGVSCNQTKGVVLLVVLVLLLSVSLAGISSLRNGIYQQSMVSNSQVEVFALQATESAINSVLEEGQLISSQQEGDSYFRRAMLQDRQVNCFDGRHFSKEQADCEALTVFGLENTTRAGNLYSYAVTEKKGIMPAPGYDVEQFVFHVFDTTGVGYIGNEHGVNVGHAHANTQRWKRFGVASGFDAVRPR
jgi:Tfp pilus assembly protein PilV